MPLPKAGSAVVITVQEYFEIKANLVIKSVFQIGFQVNREVFPDQRIQSIQNQEGKSNVRITHSHL